MKTVLSIIFLTLLTFGLNAQELARASQGKAYGFINQKGEFAIKEQFGKAGDFSDDFAAVFDKNVKKWGYINRKGELVIPYTFDRAKDFDSGIAIVNSEKEWFYINKKGERINNFPESSKLYDFNQGRALIRVGDKIGFMDNKGNILVEPSYQTIVFIDKEHARAKKNDKWGIIDRKGKEVVSFEYDHIGNVINKGTITAVKNEVHGVVVNNKFVPVEGAEKIWDFNDDGIAYAKSEGKIGYIDSKGNWIIKAKFDKARAFNNGLAPVMENKQWGYIDVKGEWVIEPKYRDAEVFSDDGLAPIKSNKDWGFINKKGELIVPEKYGISVGLSLDFSGKGREKGYFNGLARVKSSSGWNFIDTKGNPINSKGFKNLELFN